jgi:hypothetical protein
VDTRNGTKTLFTLPASEIFPENSVYGITTDYPYSPDPVDFSYLPSTTRNTSGPSYFRSIPDDVSNGNFGETVNMTPHCKNCTKIKYYYDDESNVGYTHSNFYALNNLNLINSFPGGILGSDMEELIDIALLPPSNYTSSNISTYNNISNYFENNSISGYAKVNYHKPLYYELNKNNEFANNNSIRLNKLKFIFNLINMWNGGIVDTSVPHLDYWNNASYDGGKKWELSPGFNVEGPCGISSDYLCASTAGGPWDDGCPDCDPTCDGFDWANVPAGDRVEVCCKLYDRISDSYEEKIVKKFICDCFGGEILASGCSSSSSSSSVWNSSSSSSALFSSFDISEVESLLYDLNKPFN